MHAADQFSNFLNMKLGILRKESIVEMFYYRRHNRWRSVQNTFFQHFRVHFSLSKSGRKYNKIKMRQKKLHKTLKKCRFTICGCQDIQVGQKHQHFRRITLIWGAVLVKIYCRANFSRIDSAAISFPVSPKKFNCNTQR